MVLQFYPASEHPENLLNKLKGLNPTAFYFSRSGVRAKFAFLNKFLVNALAASPGTTLEKHLYRNQKSYSSLEYCFLEYIQRICLTYMWFFKNQSVLNEK